jgi:hypothetical protein
LISGAIACSKLTKTGTSFDDLGYLLQRCEAVFVRSMGKVANLSYVDGSCAEVVLCNTVSILHVLGLTSEGLTSTQISEAIDLEIASR